MLEKRTQIAKTKLREKKAKNMLGPNSQNIVVGERALWRLLVVSLSRERLVRSSSVESSLVERE